MTNIHTVLTIYTRNCSSYYIYSCILTAIEYVNQDIQSLGSFTDVPLNFFNSLSLFHYCILSYLSNWQIYNNQYFLESTFINFFNSLFSSFFISFSIHMFSIYNVPGYCTVDVVFSIQIITGKDKFLPTSVVFNHPFTCCYLEIFFTRLIYL